MIRISTRIIIIGGIYFSNYQSNNYAQPEVAFEDTAEVVDTAAAVFEIDSPLGKYKCDGPFDEQTRPHGICEVFFIDGRYYKGGIVHGVFSGDDVIFKYQNGDEFKGSFRNNSFYEGTYTIAEDGSYFEGTFKKGQPDKGHWYDKNGNLIE